MSNRPVTIMIFFASLCLPVASVAEDAGCPKSKSPEETYETVAQAMTASNWRGALACFDSAGKRSFFTQLCVSTALVYGFTDDENPELVAAMESQCQETSYDVSHLSKAEISFLNESFAYLLAVGGKESPPRHRKIKRVTEGDSQIEAQEFIDGKRQKVTLSFIRTAVGWRIHRWDALDQKDLTKRNGEKG